MAALGVITGGLHTFILLCGCSFSPSSHFLTSSSPSSFLITVNCTCSQSTGCIMGAVLGSVVPNQWSSCSTQYLSTALGANHAYCLTNQPQSFAGPPVCGNGIQEGNEVCDCGSAMVSMLFFFLSIQSLRV